MQELYSIEDIGYSTGLEFFLEPLTTLFGGQLDKLKATDFFATEIEENGSLTHIYSVVLAVKEEVLISIPDFDAIRLGVAPDSPDEWPLIYCEITMGQASQALSIKHFPLRIEIDNPYLQPVQLEEEQTTLDAFSFEVEGSFTVINSDELSMTATLESFSVPPFKIVGTGLVLALTECSLITRDDDVGTAITDLGFNKMFRGLHAKSALLHWDLPIQLNGYELPGIHANFENIALGNQGVSVSAKLNWPVVYQNGQFDAEAEISGFFIDPEWAFALASLSIGIQANIPNAMGAEGYVRIPFLDAIFKLEFSLIYLQKDETGKDEYELQGSLSLGDNETIVIELDANSATDYQIELSKLRISGKFEGDDKFEFEGSTDYTINLPGLTVETDTATLKLKHSPQGDTYQLQITQIEIENVGSFDESELTIITRRTEDGVVDLKSFQLTTTVIWSDISTKLTLGQVPDGFPLPPDDAQLTLQVRWKDNEMLLSLKAKLEDVDQLWRFIPEDQRPEIEKASINIELTWNGNDFTSELGLELRLRLPEINQLPGFEAAGLGDLVQIETGDAEGWIDATFKAEVGSSTDANAGSLSATLNNPIDLAFNLPGLVLPAPPLELSITEISIKLSSEEEQSEGEFQLKGDFLLRPILPSNLSGLVVPPMAVHLERLLSIAQLYDLQGKAELRLGVSETGGYCEIICTFVDVALEIDLFDMLVGVTNQLPATANEQAAQIDIDIDVSLQLSTLTLSVGQLPDAKKSDHPIPFSFGFTAQLGFAGQNADMTFELSNESFSFGFDKLSIPIALPELPLSREDLNALYDNSGRWDVAIWQNVEVNIDASLNEDEDALREAEKELKELEDNPLDTDNYTQQVFELEFRLIPALRKNIFHNTGKKILTAAVMTIYNELGRRSGPTNQAVYQGMVERYQDAVDLTLGSLKFDTGLQFEITDAKFVLPFNDPSNIKVEGGATLRGFAPDSPLKPLEDLVFKLGISSDAIYFSVEGGADPIPLPDFGRYPGNAIIFDRLIIGYGYSKNSLLIDFAGELQLSPELIEDADTSSRLGIGVKLPNNSRLKFKLDLIPISLGKVNFLLPLIAFDINLRSENPPLAPPSYNCTPAWDGLQLHIPGALRAGFKRLQFSPFFGPLPAPNSLMAYDIDIGNKQLGYTMICDNYQVITPLLGQFPIPFLADNIPFFDQYCINLRLAGFGINFELRRPFPSPNPLLIFELMGFIADPSLPIDPAGELANLMSAELNNARITLPPAVLSMFPEQGEMLSRELNIRVNVGTVIALAQQLAGVIENLQQRQLQTSTEAVENRQQNRLIQSTRAINRSPQHPTGIAGFIGGLTQNPLPIVISEILDSLPPELRRLELNGSFIGFDASAVFLLISPSALHAQRSSPLPSAFPPSTPDSRWINVVTDEFSTNASLNGWRSVDYGLSKKNQSAWKVDNGILLQTKNVGRSSSKRRYGPALIREMDPLSELRISVDLKSNDDDGIGVLFHVQGENTYYRFRMTSQHKEWHLVRFNKGAMQELYKTNIPYEVGKTYQVRIEVQRTPQSAIDRQPPSDTRRIDRLNLGRSSQNSERRERVTTHIRIWVNESLWCDVNDDVNPLTKGQVGLDTWWNNGAQFSNFTLDRLERQTSAPMIPLAEDLVSSMSWQSDVMAKTTDTSDWLMDDLAGFSDDDIVQAIPGTGSSAVVIAAQVKVFDTQSFRFLGVIQTDGRFNLLTTANADSLTLSVAGIELGFSLTVEGRMRVEGRSAGVDSFARFRADLYGDWNILSSDDSLARLIIGTQSKPANIVIDSQQGFQLQGDGELQLFANQLSISGDVDISHQHAFIRGEFAFRPAFEVSQDIPVLDLTMTTEGRVGPGQSFLLAGSGTLHLMGKKFSAVSGELSPDGLTLEARLNAGKTDNWSINGFHLPKAEMALQGKIGFTGSVPDILFQGSGSLEIADVKIEGDCYINVNAQKWCLGASGRLNWQGQDWLQGGIELCNDRLTVQGQAQFVLDLTPDLPGNIQVAGVVLSATIGGSFTLLSSGQLAACNFTLDWAMSIKLPGSQANQLLPVASQRLNINKPNIFDQEDSVTLADLINIDGLTLFSLEGVSIPVPTLSATDTDEDNSIYLYKSINIDPGPASLPFPLLTTRPQDSNDEDNTFVAGIPAINILGISEPNPLSLYSETPKVNIGGFDVPIPYLSNVAPEDDQDADFLFSITTTETPISGEMTLNDFKLKLALKWENNRLGIWMEAGENEGKHIPFDKRAASKKTTRPDKV
ncbi:MAG: hypothetical protein L3J98_06835 [Gammaproteobacteria bacterium]|nr:hypothetical protein [Gammaproteobacteria bacterium]MCF6259862.1 hypothetical protein [Gammaproteobacteria bacterium]